MELSETQLLLDDEAIESHTRVHRKVHQPQRFGPDPILRPDRAWEGQCVCLYGSVLQDPESGLYHMYYQTFNKVPPPENTYVCCATSEDGLTWEKPEIGDVAYRGSKRNNIVLEGFHGGLDSPSVILDPDDPDRRYKLLTYGRAPGGAGLYAAFSGDGLHWRAREEMVAPGVGDRTNVMLDAGKAAPYVAYTRRGTMMRDHGRRTVYRSESADFVTWSDPQLALAPDLADSHDLQFYGFSAFRCGSAYVGLLQVLHSLEDVQDIQLAVSRDNVAWERVEPREVFFPLGRRDSWEGAWVSIASNAPIERDGRLWFHYEGRNAAHGQVWPFPKGAIGVAMLRRDGFASLEAGPTEAHVTTKPVRWSGGRLLVNVDCKAAGATDGAQMVGTARLEVLDDAGNAVPGLTREECEVFRGDALDHEFAWSSGKTLDGLKGETIRLRFWLVSARLYAFRRGQ